MRTSLLLAIGLLTLTACRGGEEEEDTSTAVDADADGSPEGEDCDDNDPASYPGADELCDGVDNDCDGAVDNDAVDTTTFWLDSDGDGHGNPAVEATSCAAEEGYVDNSTDCDDSRADINPGAVEDDCTDPTDYNCDGSVGFADGDGDGVPACEDCNDSDAAVNPQGTEICDEVDNDCDGGVDNDAVDASTFYADADADSFGDASTTTEACAQPDGHVTDATDCDDTADTVNPGATETCNDVDDDCDGTADDDATDAPTWYADADGDGYGGTQFSLTQCDQPDGYVSSSDDCNDLQPTWNPDGVEVCDGSDNDCDGETDEAGAQGEREWYADSDGDTYGDASSTTSACNRPTGYVAGKTDCNDSSDSIYPGADEYCNDVDDDCDSTVDEDAVDESVFYADSDGDGYGRPNSGVEACDAPNAHVDNFDDCNDSVASVNPDGTEVPDNSLDDNCDGNQPPEPAPSVEINPARPSVDVDLVCGLASDNSTTDPDGDPVEYLVTWYLDDQPWEGVTATTTLSGDTIEAVDTALDDVWTCEITPTDGSELGTPGAADAIVSEWLSLSDGSSCNNWQGSGVTQVFCGQNTNSYAECETYCNNVDPSSMVHWGNQNGNYQAWGSVVAVSYELCDNDTTCDDGDDDNFWSKYSTTNPQEYCTGSGIRMTCNSSWWTSGTGPTRCFCYR